MNIDQRGAIKLVPILITIGLMLASAAGVYFWQQQEIDDLNQEIASLNQQLEKANADGATNTETYFTFTSEKGVKIRVLQPKEDELLTSPVAVIGQVPGNWSNEASFPVQLKDAEGNIVAQSAATVLGDWQTEELVVFSAKLTFSSAPVGDGTLILQKDNPSGLPENDDSVSIPIKF